MNPVVKKDILNVLKQAIIIVKKNELLRLREISDHVIHNASVFQDKDSIRIAVTIYALSKLYKDEKEIDKFVLPRLKNAVDALEKGDLNHYEKEIKNIIKDISNRHEKTKYYIQEVLERAQIKKASRMYEHGISMGQVAEALGVSMWDLMDYVGKTRIAEGFDYKTNITEKLNYARSMSDSLVFDTGPIISLALNDLLWILEELKSQFKGDFYITDGVKKEVVERPLKGKKFKLEALQVLKLIEDGVLKVYDQSLKDETLELLNLANSLFKGHGSYIKNVQYAEIEAIVAAKKLGAEAVVIDEFITRTLVENPMAVKDRMKRKLHMSIEHDDKNIMKFQEETKGIYVLRSVELVTLAFEKGFFKEYILDIPNPRKELLEALLWGVKLNGCSVTEPEIKDLLKIQKIA